jgi:Phytanoyl-CoA dioxygenase (PhyH)
MWQGLSSWLTRASTAGPTTSRAFGNDRMDRELAQDGYLVLPFLDPADIEALRRLHDRMMPALPADFTATTLDDDLQFRRRVSAGIRRIVEGRLKRIVPGHRLVLATFVSKRARTTRGRVNLHQDWWLVDNRVHRALHFWCPLVDVGPRNGCLKVVPGVHRLLNSPYPIHPPSYRTAYHPVLPRLDAELVRRVSMPAGSALVYDERMLHGSDDNLSDEPRAAFNCVMIPEDLEPIVYWWDERQPGRLSILEVSEDFLCRFRYGTPLQEPYPDDVRRRGTTEAAVRPLGDAELEALACGRRHG